MMGLSPVHIILLAVVGMLVFGGGRFSATMGDVAKGIKAFKKGVAEPEDVTDQPAGRGSPRLTETGEGRAS